MSMKDNHSLVTKRYIYYLIDPRNGEVFYVGQTVNPGQRLQAHVDGKSSSQRRRSRIDDIVQSGTYPVMKTISSVTGTYADACKIEYSEIASFPREQLTNESNLGKGLKKGWAR